MRAGRGELSHLERARATALPNWASTKMGSTACFKAPAGLMDCGGPDPKAAPTLPCSRRKARLRLTETSISRQMLVDGSLSMFAAPGREHHLCLFCNFFVVLDWEQTRV